MKIKGTVTRVVTKDTHPQGVEREHAVFVRPGDLADLRNVDGSKRAGIDEVRATFQSAEDLSGFKVGEQAEIDV